MRGVEDNTRLTTRCLQDAVAKKKKVTTKAVEAMQRESGCMRCQENHLARENATHRQRRYSTVYVPLVHADR